MHHFANHRGAAAFPGIYVILVVLMIFVEAFVEENVLCDFWQSDVKLDVCLGTSKAQSVFRRYVKELLHFCKVFLDDLKLNAFFSVSL